MAKSASASAAIVMRGVLAGIAAATIWSGWYVLARHGVTAGGLDPYDLAALRFMVAAPILMLLVRRVPFPMVKLPLALLMTLGVGPPFVILVGHGFLAAPALFGGAVSASSGVVFTLLGGTLFLGERLSRVQAGGIAITLVGLVWLAMAAGGSGHIGYFLAGGVLWAVYGVAFRRSGLTALEAVTTVALLSALVYLPFYFWLAGARILAATSQELVLQGLGQGVLTGIVALALHACAVADLGAIKGALFQSLVPAFTLILAAAFLREIPDQAEIAAILIILWGVYMALKYRA
ncbi:drug/metabolite transporter (DMT)-like permease [Pseudochelatococcus lubricantis]|uniref:Drug/metabolite transporter (DMT)-like permease n=1 Tax=Pseudochelatococcus lubricantis TaxID=1538102 RepID=A0ABX0V1D1_9HYPH|nr:DMT family transporter [Pseudochelatococcus lubricantis]NIJ58782.1 drug/metabolite transporter (DMT)-like permease [Pseudochelatococcus lubricantis]